MTRRLTEVWKIDTWVGDRSLVAVVSVLERRARTMRTQAHGVAVGAMSRAEADHLLAEQKAQLPVYVGRAFRTPEQQVQFLCRVH